MIDIDLIKKNIKNLEFNRLDSQFSTGFISNVKFFGVCYVIYNDTSTGAVVLSAPDKSKTTHSSFDEAKEYANNDYKERIIKLIE